jgi:molybdate-binding protein/DNA-binding XRE family transcriptional regulator
MKSGEISLICNLKTMRQAKGISQAQLAELIGVKRQAIYDIETGKYTPNTALALRLAKYMQCTVEDLFVEEVSGEEGVILVDAVSVETTRVAMARIRGQLLAYPLTGKRLLLEGFEPADGVMTVHSGSARLLSPASSLDQTLILFGCDPAFSILGTHTMRHAPQVRVHCLFASSRNALRKLGAGQAHLAGTHMHSTAKGDGNLLLVRDCLGDSPVTVLAFSHIEEGLMLAPGNPTGVRSVADLADGPRLINREPGAALRSLLDEQLAKYGIPGVHVVGYDQEATTHHDSALHVLFGKADVALGFRAIAESYGLDFIPIETVRCDLIVPRDLQYQTELGYLLDTLQTRKMREDLRSLPGYEAGDTGKVIAEL